MSAPYWGQLPPAKARRRSKDLDQTDRRRSLEQSNSTSQPAPRSNRTSTQTANTDMNTESTFTPYDSPVASSFQGNGLAPRPPSLPYNQDRYLPELAENRKGRISRDPPESAHEISHEEAASPPPAAPDVPRAPPVSYKLPYGSSGSPYTYNAAGQPGPPMSSRRSITPTEADVMDPEAFYKTATPPAELYSKAPPLDRNRQRFDERRAVSEQTARDVERSASVRKPVNGSRRESLGAEPQRKAWAVDRSPLQRLELTLDSITKEEKRARVEAAEQRAREKAALAAQAVKGGKEERSGGPTRHRQSSPDRDGQQVHPRDRRQSGGYDARRRAIVADPVQAQPTAAPAGNQLYHNEDRKRHENSGPPVRSHIPVAKTRNAVATVDKAGIPRRNLSFRERAASDDLDLPEQAVSSPAAASPITSPAGGIAVARSGSNKLKKSPPGDPWYVARTKAEEESAARGRPGVEPDEPMESPSSFRTNSIEARPAGGIVRKNLSPPEMAGRPPGRGKHYQEPAYYDGGPSRMRGFAAAIGLGRSNSLGNRPPQDAYRSSQDAHRPPPQDIKDANYEEFDDSPPRRRGFAAAIGLGQPNSMGAHRRSSPPRDTKGEGYGEYNEPPSRRKGIAAAFGQGRTNSTFSPRQPAPPRDMKDEGYEGLDDSPPRRRGFAAAIGLGQPNSMGARRQSSPTRDTKDEGYEGYEEYGEPPPRRKGFAAAIGLGRTNSTDSRRQPAPPRTTKDVDYEEFDDPPPQRNGLAAATGRGRTNSAGARQQAPPPEREIKKAPSRENVVKSVKFPDPEHEARIHNDDDSDTSSHGHGFREYMHRDRLKPGQGIYQPPTYLDEWRKGTIGTLSGSLLDISEDPTPSADKNVTWWEGSGKRKSGASARPPNAGAFEGERDDTSSPTNFNPPLYLKCGPLLRYCGIREEKPVARTSRSGTPLDREIWRGSVLIVTQDSESVYDKPPNLRLFVQPIELLPPPPAELRGEPLLPEYVDPIAGIPKIGRRGETLFVRPVDHLEEGKDASVLETNGDDGLFEATRTPPDFDAKSPEPPGSFTSRKRRTEVDGEKIRKVKDVRGFRLHTERGHTFWRFNIEVELRDKQQRIAYRVNGGPATGFWVPARGQSMNIMFHSCNGFSKTVDRDDFCGPDPMWRDVLNNHQTRPFHLMIGGGDQIYNDAVMDKTEHFKDWLEINNPLHKNNAPFTSKMQDELESFYLDRYMMWFSQGLFGLASSQIPMVNMYDDHDIIDGFGSYPHHFMKSPVFSGLGNVAFKYYMLFQHQSIPEETEESEPSWVLGVERGPYIHELSRSLFMSLGSKVALLAVDCRTERTRDKVIQEETWKKIQDRCYDEIVKGKTQHLLVLLGVPIAYPRLVWLENLLTSRLLDPIKALGKAGMLGKFLNNFDGGVEVLDDLDDHWTAKNHKEERKFVIEDLQDLAADKSVRITIISGDVHLAAIGQFYSNPKQQLPKHKDFRYIPNVISSAIVNAPPPDLMADILNRRNKVHHLDDETDEDMIPIFTHGVDGKPRNNKRMLPHRNWCSIREYVPGHTPPPTPPPPLEEHEYTPQGTPPGSRGSIFRRFSKSKDKGPALRPDAPREPTDRSRPPLAAGGGFFSRRASSSDPSRRSGPGKLLRTLSLGRGDSARPRNFFRRTSSTDRPDDGGINGEWGMDDSQEDFYDDAPPPPRRTRPAAWAGEPQDTLGLRGGAGGSREYDVGDDSYFTARPPRRAVTQPSAVTQSPYDEADLEDEPVRRPFHRTPTGLNARQLKKGGNRYDVDLEGGLEICLNAEVNPKDPAGITELYRLLVPRLWYEYQGEDVERGGIHADSEVEELEPESEPPRQPVNPGYGDDEDYYDDDGGYYKEQKRGGNGSGGPLKRWFSGRGSKGGSQYRARRQDG